MQGRAIGAMPGQRHGYKVGQLLTLSQVGELRKMADQGYDVKVSRTGTGFRLDYLNRVLPGSPNSQVSDAKRSDG